MPISSKKGPRFFSACALCAPLVLFGTGLLGLIGIGRRRRKVQ